MKAGCIFRFMHSRFTKYSQSNLNTLYLDFGSTLLFICAPHETRVGGVKNPHESNNETPKDVSNLFLQEI